MSISCDSVLDDVERVVANRASIDAQTRWLAICARILRAGVKPEAAAAVDAASAHVGDVSLDLLIREALKRCN